jgi:hypothetical protein
VFIKPTIVKVAARNAGTIKGKNRLKNAFFISIPHLMLICCTIILPQSGKEEFPKTNKHSEEGFGF